MRGWITLVEGLSAPQSMPFDGEVFHCSNERFDRFRMNQDRGVYFSNEPDSEYGLYTYRCHLRLDNAAYYHSVDNMEIDRNELIEEGFDGRIVDYVEESDVPMFDYIAFHDHQITIIEIIENK